VALADLSAANALRMARAVGIDLYVDGDDLVLEAVEPPSDQVIDALSQNKSGIVELLRPDADGWTVEDWKVLFDERAGIAEFEGGLLREDAEATAFAYCVAESRRRRQGGAMEIDDP
jgi:hypothetical protein